MVLTLRRITRGDLHRLFRWRNDPRIYHWCRQFAPLHWENHTHWFEKQAVDSTVSFFTVIDDLQPVGVCGLTSIDLVNRRAEFSLYIGPEFQGNGYALEALQLLFYHGFRELGLNRIWGETFADNPAMNIFTKKLGMEVEGTRREFYFRDGHFIDAHLVSLRASDFHYTPDRETERREAEILDHARATYEDHETRSDLFI